MLKMCTYFELAVLPRRRYCTLLSFFFFFIIPFAYSIRAECFFSVRFRTFRSEFWIVLWMFLFYFFLFLKNNEMYSTANCCSSKYDQTAVHNRTVIQFITNKSIHNVLVLMRFLHGNSLCLIWILTSIKTVNTCTEHEYVINWNLFYYGSKSMYLISNLLLKIWYLCIYGYLSRAIDVSFRESLLKLVAVIGPYFQCAFHRTSKLCKKKET